MTTSRRRGLPEGIQERHRDSCGSRNGGRCNCSRSYRASIYDPRTKRNRYSGWKRDLGAVQKWRAQAQRELDAELSAGTPPVGSTDVLSELWADWIKRARSGAVANRNGQQYKPAALAGYER